MARMIHRAFWGMRPGRPPELLQPGEAQVATNVRVNDGSIEPRNALSASVLTLSSVTQAQTIYRFGQLTESETNHWLELTVDGDFVKGPVADDTEERTYFTGVGLYPRKTNASLATGAAPKPTNVLRMGVVRPGGTAGSPEVASTFTPSTSVAGTGTGDPVTVIYTTTYVTSWGEESPPSLSSAAVTYDPGQVVTVTLPSAPVGNYDVESVRLYRSNTGTEATQFQLVTEVAVGTADYDDDTASSALGETLSSSYYTEPDDEMVGLTLLPNGGMMGFFQNQLCFCEPGFPHAWPIRYRRSMAAPIVALAAFESQVVVFTTRGTYLLMGSEPANMVESTAVVPQVCVSKRSVQNFNNGAVFAGRDGLYHVSPGGVRNLVGSIMESEDWEQFYPDTILGVATEDTYIGFYDTGSEQAGFVISAGGSGAAFVKTTVHATAAFLEKSTGVLFLATTGNLLKKWEGGAPATAVWRSGIHREPSTCTMSAARVEADDYPLTFKLYADGALKHTQSVTGAGLFRLPGGYRARKFEYQLETDKVVTYVGVASSAAELGRDG